MKNIFFAALLMTFFSFSILLFQISCKSDVIAQSNNSNCIGEKPLFQFKANGILHNCDALFDSRVGWYGNTESSSVRNLIEGELPSIAKDLGATGYSFSGGNQQAYLNFLNFSTSPSVGTSTVTNGAADCKIPSFTLFTKATYTIAFTRIAGGTADGTFTATLINPASPQTTVSVTEGSFKNLMIIQ